MDPKHRSFRLTKPPESPDYRRYKEDMRGKRVKPRLNRLSILIECITLLSGIWSLAVYVSVLCQTESPPDFWIIVLATVASMIVTERGLVAILNKMGIFSDQEAIRYPTYIWTLRYNRYPIYPDSWIEPDR